MGISALETTEDLKRIYPLNKKLYDSINKSYGMGTFRKFEAFLSDFYEGTCHSMNTLMYKGDCIFWNACDYVTDTKKYNMLIEEESVFPSRVFANEAELEKVKNYIVETLKLFKFEDGLFNFDFIYTNQGVKIIDINPRVAGWYHELYTRKITGMCIFKIEALLHMNIRLVQHPVPSHYFTVDSLSYMDPKETEGFTSDNYFEISPEKYFVSEKLYFAKIDVYRKNYNK